MSRDVADLKTTFTVDGAAAVSQAFTEASKVVSISERDFEPRCADPAVCGSEWAAGHDIGSGTAAVMCSRCGRSGTIHQAVEAKVARTADDSLRDELRRYSPVILAVVFLGLGGCATAPTGGPGKGGAWCEIERPIALSGATIDAMTSTELKAAVTHNRHGEAECGWKPREKKS